MTDTVLLGNVAAGVLLVVLGFMIRLTLESWRDYHVSKALHEAKLRSGEWEETPHQSPAVTASPVGKPAAERPQYVDELTKLREQNHMPLGVLARIKMGLKTTGYAGAARIYGRWYYGKRRNAA